MHSTVPERIFLGIRFDFARKCRILSRLRMDHLEAERLRANDRNWSWGFVYRCPEDPRLIVRNRRFIGWTWNFGHSGILLALPAAVLFAVGIPYLVVASGMASRSLVVATFVGCVMILMIIANRIASGPASSGPRPSGDSGP